MLCLQSLSFGYPSFYEPFCVAIRGDVSLSVDWGGRGSACSCRPRFAETPATIRLVYYVVLGALHECAGTGDGASGTARVLVLGAWETNADALNPMTISHTPTTASHRPPAYEERSPRPDPKTAETIPHKMIAYPSRPQTASQRGTNFAR